MNLRRSDLTWEDCVQFLVGPEPNRPRCHCGLLMYRAEGVVPVWRCGECKREVPRV